MFLFRFLFYLLFFFFFGEISILSVNAQTLSPQARISLITCSPGNELYSMYGHSAIRVADPLAGIDYVFNYGTFDFNTPNFYGKFVRGKLNYQLSVADYPNFLATYQYYNRSVYEQILNLTPRQRNAVYAFLQTNYQPENRAYLYDFFFDNCATRIRDVFKNILRDSLQFDNQVAQKSLSFRQLVSIYQQPFPWADFGVDLAMGVPSDRKATAPEYMFLPDYLSAGLGRARVQTPHGSQPFAQPVTTIFQAQPPPVTSAVIFTPLVICWALFGLGALLTWRQLRQQRPPATYAADALLFGTVGLLGGVVLFLTTGTDHKAFARNLNLLWTIPLHLPVAFLLLRQHSLGFLKIYFLLTALLMGLLVLTWQWLPQEYHPAFLPLVLLLAVRAGYIYFTQKRSAAAKRFTERIVQ